MKAIFNFFLKKKRWSISYSKEFKDYIVVGMDQRVRFVGSRAACVEYMKAPKYQQLEASNVSWYVPYTGD